MRIGALLLVGLGILSAAACTSSTSPDQTCSSMNAVCLALPDAAALPKGCGEQINGAICDEGYVCCAPTSAVLNDGAVPSTSAAATSAASSAASKASSAAPADAGSKG